MADARRGGPALRLAVANRADAERARREAHALATALAFDAPRADAVALAVLELATNLVRHARQGELELTAVDGPRGRGVQVESWDAGPGIADVERAFEDRFSTAGGLGSGLPAVLRLTDELEIETGPDGTRIVTRTWAATP
jgi:anti-sigma regulatory factor (Ser/Thr protein kinase)